MTIYTFPESLWNLTQLSFSLVARSATSPQSAFNPLTFTDGPTSEFWQVSATIWQMSDDGTTLSTDNWRDLSALLRKLRGRRNKIRLFDPSRKMRGAGGVSPTLNIEADASAGATSVQINGLIASQAVALAADDLLGIGENLYAVSDDAPSDADGKATVSILAPLRKGVAAGDTVNTLRPTALFQLVSGGDALTVVAPLLSQPLTLQFFEDPDFD